MQSSDLRVALFSGNYNYVRDGANQALNRLVGYLLRQGVKVRVYSPTIAEPAFPATGDVVSIPAIPIPGDPNIGCRSRFRRKSAATSPSSIPTWSTSPAPTSSGTAR